MHNYDLLKCDDIVESHILSNENDFVEYSFNLPLRFTVLQNSKYLEDVKPISIKYSSNGDVGKLYVTGLPIKNVVENSVEYYFQDFPIELNGNLKLEFDAFLKCFAFKNHEKLQNIEDKKDIFYTILSEILYCGVPSNSIRFNIEKLSIIHKYKMNFKHGALNCYDCFCCLYHVC